MPEVKRRTPANVIVEHDNGEIENVPLSPKNKLLFDKNLWGLLKKGDEILQIDGDPSVSIIPNDSATEFTIQVEGAQPIHLGADQKQLLVETLEEAYDDTGDGDLDPRKLIDLRDDLMENRVRKEVVDYLAEMPPFSEYVENGNIQIIGSGWLFYDELLLTWGREFRHPNTTSKARNGSIISPDAADSAYDVRFSGVMDNTHSVTIDGEGYRLTSKEMEFMAKALWAMKIPTPS